MTPAVVLAEKCNVLQQRLDRLRKASGYAVTTAEIEDATLALLDAQLELAREQQRMTLTDLRS